MRILRPGTTDSMAAQARRVRSWIPGLALCLLAAQLAACASLPRRDPLNIDVAGIQVLPGEGMELRLAVKLRVQNPNDSAIDYRGAALQLSVNGRRLATGVSDTSGSVPRYGEALLTVPVTISAVDMIRQAAALTERDGSLHWNYRVEGKLEGGLFGTRRFSGGGTLDLPRGWEADRRP